VLVVCVVRCVCVWLRERCAYDHRAVACDHIDGCVVVCVVLSARACEYCNDHKLTLINVSLKRMNCAIHPTPNSQSTPFLRQALSLPCLRFWNTSPAADPLSTASYHEPQASYPAPRPAASTSSILEYVTMAPPLLLTRKKSERKGERCCYLGT
jgi:hypothetical protein